MTGQHADERRDAIQQGIDWRHSLPPLHDVDIEQAALNRYSQVWEGSRKQQRDHADALRSALATAALECAAVELAQVAREIAATLHGSFDDRDDEIYRDVITADVQLLRARAATFRDRARRTRTLPASSTDPRPLPTGEVEASPQEKEEGTLG